MIPGGAEVVVPIDFPKHRVTGKCPAGGWIIGLVFLEEGITLCPDGDGEVHSAVRDAVGSTYHFESADEAREAFYHIIERNGVLNETSVVGDEEPVGVDEYEGGISFVARHVMGDLFPNTKCGRCNSWGHTPGAVAEGHCGKCVQDEHDEKEKLKDGGKKSTSRSRVTIVDDLEENEECEGDGGIESNGSDEDDEGEWGSAPMIQ